MLNRMRAKVRNRQYVVTIHADEEIYKDGLTVLNVEGAILRGAIIERQKDVNTGEWKYVVEGKSFEGERIGVVVKWSFTEDLVIITVYYA